MNNTHQEFFQKVLHLFKKVLDVFGETLEGINKEKGQCFDYTALLFYCIVCNYTLKRKCMMSPS